ncbi:MAG: hypothetical protein ABI231_10435 [Candidatus Tumulicola sp.]
MRRRFQQRRADRQRQSHRHQSYSAVATIPGTLGQQELQVYAGGGTVGQNASGFAGFINQVIKTGTRPGYASVSAGIGTPIFDHNLQFEVFNVKL